LSMVNVFIYAFTMSGDRGAKPDVLLLLDGQRLLAKEPSCHEP